MRTAFFNELMSLMQRDESLYLLVADMGLGLVEPFQKEFPTRFLNVGIAEQNMIGISAGLCNAGFRPICYTISNFLIERPLEQIRNDLCLHNYPVILVGASTGFDNGKLGPTHQVIDDIGCLKVFPNINIFSPSSTLSAKLALQESIKHNGPAYVRLGKGSYIENTASSSINHMIADSALAEILIITHGNILENSVNAAVTNKKLAVFAMNQIKPLDNAILNSLFSRFKRIIIVEDHFANSGLYNSLCQYLVESKVLDVFLSCIAPPCRYDERVGDSNHFAEKYDYSINKLTEIFAHL